MIKVGTNVKSKVHDDLTGHVVICQPLNNYAVIMTDIIAYEMMTVSELVERLLDFDGNEEITFYYLKDNILTNSRLEDINSYGMGIEFTIQDTHEFMEENS